MSKLIRNWDELRAMSGESDTHALEVEDHCGWIYVKNRKRYDDHIPYEDQWLTLDHYLSTHTFYGHQHKNSTKLLQTCGFDVIIDNWDKEDE